MAVAGVKTPPNPASGGSAVPSGGVRTKAKADSANMTAYHISMPYGMRSGGRNSQHVLRYPGSPDPFNLVMTWILGSVVSETLSTAHQPFSSLLHTVSVRHSLKSIKVDLLPCSSFSWLGDDLVDKEAELVVRQIYSICIEQAVTYDPGGEE